MVTRWHLINLPVRLAGQARHWTVVKHVMITWPAGKVSGFTLHSGPFRTLFLPVGPAVGITPTGIEFTRRDLLERRSRKWIKQQLQEDWVSRHMPMHDSRGRLLGIVKDAVLDEMSMEVKDLVVSQGLLADLLGGSLRVPLSTVRCIEDGSGATKIQQLGYAKGEVDRSIK